MGGEAERGGPSSEVEGWVHIRCRSVGLGRWGLQLGGTGIEVGSGIDTGEGGRGTMHTMSTAGCLAAALTSRERRAWWTGQV